MINLISQAAMRSGKQVKQVCEREDLIASLSVILDDTNGFQIPLRIGPFQASSSLFGSFLYTLCNK